MQKIRRTLGKGNKDRDGKLFNFRPITFCAVFLALGIALGVYVCWKGGSAWWALALLPFAVLIAFFSLPLNRVARWSVILCLVSAVGFFSIVGVSARFRSHTVYDGQYVVTGVVEEKTESLGGYRLLLDDLTIDGNAEKGSLIAYPPASFGKNVRLADQIVVKGEVKTDLSVVKGDDLYASMLSKDTAYKLSSVTEMQTIGSAFRPFLWLRQRVYDVLESGMDETPAAFSAGLLLGDDSGVERGLLQNVRNGGVAHLFAVSGLHIGVLFGFCAFLTDRKFFLRFPKWVSLLFTATILFFYGGVCGFSVSVIRALVTCLSAYASRLFGVKKDYLESISFAAIVVLLIFPASLYDVGFLLSFSACYGLVLFVGPLEKLQKKAYGFLYETWQYKIRKKRRQEADIFKGDTPPKSIAVRIRDKIISLSSATFSAWLTTTPVSVCFFAYSSTWGLWLNLLFVPLASVFFIGLLCVVVLACLIPFASSVLLYVPNVLLSAVALFFEIFTFEGAQLSIGAGAIACCASGLLFCTDKISLSRRTRLIAAAVAFSACVVCLIALNLP